MVFIHGGSFRLGSAYEYGVDGILKNLVSKGVVVVVVQYRLGLFGLIGHSLVLLVDIPVFQAFSPPLILPSPAIGVSGIRSKLSNGSRITSRSSAVIQTQSLSSGRVLELLALLS